MATKSKRRFEEDGKKTQFKRRCETGEWQEVPPKKLETWQRRFHQESTNGSLDLSKCQWVKGQAHIFLIYLDTPSNIAYNTPSTSDSITPDSSSSDIQSSSSFSYESNFSPLSETQQEVRLREFNNEFLRTWLDSTGRCFSRYREARYENSFRISKRRWNQSDISALLETNDNARSLIFKHDYRNAEAKLKMVGDGFNHILGPKHWLTLVAKFEAALMQLAEQVSCSSTVAPRFLQESLSFLNARRHEYICQDSISDFRQIKDTISLIRRLTHFWINIVTYQKAAKDLTKLLGSEHKHVLQLKRHLERCEYKWKMATYASHNTHESHRNDYEQVHERVSKATENIDPWKQTSAVAAHCDHVPEAERAEMLANAQTAQPILTEAAKERMSHRTKALLGAAASFGGDHECAEDLLEEVQQKPDLEICPENRVHQLLFYAEHKTREGSWDLAKHAMLQIRHIWQGSQNSLPENLRRYFKPRIKDVLRAISSCLTIDDASNHKLTVFANCRGSPVPSLESSMTTPSSLDSDMFDQGTRTPGRGWPSPSTAVRPVDSPGSLDSQFWNDAFGSPSSKPGTGLGKSMKELSVTDPSTEAPLYAPVPDIQSTTAVSTGRLPGNFAASAREVECNTSRLVVLYRYLPPVVPN